MIRNDGGVICHWHGRLPILPRPSRGVLVVRAGRLPGCLGIVDVVLGVDECSSASVVSACVREIGSQMCSVHPVSRSLRAFAMAVSQLRARGNVL